MTRRYGSGPAALAATAVLGLVLSGLSACGPTTTKSGTAHRGHGTRASATPMNSAAALNLLERQLESRGRDMGYPPAGPIAVGYRTGRVRWLVWTAGNGGVCQGSGTLGIGPDQTACAPAATLPSGSGPALLPLTGGINGSAARWITLVVADRQELRGVTCAGIRLDVRDTLTVPLPDGGSRTFYELVSDWMFHGTATASVQRPAGAATERLHLDGTAGKSCG